LLWAYLFSGEAKNPLKNIPRAVIWSLILTGLFFVLISYVEIAGVRGYITTLDQIGAPLNVLADLFNVSYFKIPLSIGAIISFFSLSLSCLNAGSRIIFPMARHSFFHTSMGKAHTTNQTPHMAISAYIVVIVLVPTIFSVFTDPLTGFNDAGTLAAFGFLLAYFLISIAASVYLRHIGELRPFNVVITVLAVLCLLVPTIGSVYPVPSYPVNLFPYIFLTYMLVGAIWLFVVSRRSPGIIQEIETDLEATLQHNLPQHAEETPVLASEMAVE